MSRRGTMAAAMQLGALGASCLAEVLAGIYAAPLPVGECRKLAHGAVRLALGASPEASHELGSSLLLHEEALLAVGAAMGHSGSPSITSAKLWLRSQGAGGIECAARLTRLSRGRNANAHPDVGLVSAIGALGGVAKVECDSTASGSVPPAGEQSPSSLVECTSIAELYGVNLVEVGCQTDEQSLASPDLLVDALSTKVLSKKERRRAQLSLKQQRQDVADRDSATGMAFPDLVVEQAARAEAAQAVAEAEAAQAAAEAETAQAAAQAESARAAAAAEAAQAATEAAQAVAEAEAAKAAAEAESAQAAAQAEAARAAAAAEAAKAATKAEVAAPCSSYRLNVNGQNFGDCMCGFCKSAHKAGQHSAEKPTPKPVKVPQAVTAKGSKLGSSAEKPTAKPVKVPQAVTAKGSKLGSSKAKITQWLNVPREGVGILPNDLAFLQGLEDELVRRISRMERSIGIDRAMLSDKQDPDCLECLEQNEQHLQRKRVLLVHIRAKVGELMAGADA